MGKVTFGGKITHNFSSAGWLFYFSTSQIQVDDNSSTCAFTTENIFLWNSRNNIVFARFNCTV
jgi:hypothetical protein